MQVKREIKPPDIYPTYSYSSSGAESGSSNSAVFYDACGFDCLCCQNWHYRKMSPTLSPTVSPKVLGSKVGSKMTLICYFGGDRSPQMLHTLDTSEPAIERANNEGSVLNICWQTSGGMTGRFASRVVELSLSGGDNPKSYLECASENLNKPYAVRQTLLLWAILDDLEGSTPSDPKFL